MLTPHPFSSQPLAASRSRKGRTTEPLPAKNKKDKGKNPEKASPKPSPATQATQAPSDQPESDPRDGYVFLRGKVAACGCLYLTDVGPKGFATLRDLKKAGFPRHGHHCQKCKVVTTEIRIDDDGNAVVTEIVEVRPPTPDRENDISSEEEGYMDDDYDEEEASGPSSGGQHQNHES